MLPLKYVSIFWRTLEKHLINRKINLILNCVIVANTVANQNSTFSITDKKLYVPVLTLLIQDNAKLLQKLRSGFKRVINWNKCLPKPELLAQNPNLNHLVEPSSQGINSIFILAYEGDTQRTSSKGYDLPNFEINDYNIMRKLF